MSVYRSARDIEDTITDSTRTISRLWPLMLTPGSAGSLARRSPGVGALAEDHSETDADMSRLDRGVSLRREVVEDLNGWCRVVMEDRDLTRALPDGLDAVSMCAFLARHARWMSGHEAGEDCAEELRGWAAKVYAYTVPHRPESLRVGTCPVTIGHHGEAVTCGADIRVHADHPGDTRCPGCGTTDTLDGWVLRIVGEEQPYTAEQLVTVLHRRKGVQVKPSTLRQWSHRHGFPTAGTRDGQTLYDVRDVLTWMAARERVAAG